MLRGEPLTAIIPVRSGSKGIPRKNLRKIGAYSLLERTIRFALASPRIDRVIVSTDDPEMHTVAVSYGVAAPSLRRVELATDAATTADVVSHLISECSISFGFICVLQATSPFRRLSDLDGMCRAFEESSAEAAVSLARLDEPRPEKLKRIMDGKVRPYMLEGFEGPRQALEQPYRLNGAFYLIARETFIRERRFLPENCLPYVMAEEHSHNLDSMSDWKIMEAMLAAGHWTLEDYG